MRVISISLGRPVASPNPLCLDGYGHPRPKDGVHRPRRRRPTRTEPHRRTGESRPPECRAKWKPLGRPRKVVDADRIAILRAQARSWREIVTETGISKGTAQGALSGLPKNVRIPIARQNV